MRCTGYIGGVVLFAGGIGLGYWFGASPPVALPFLGGAKPEASPPSLEELRGALAALRGLWDSSGGSGRERRERSGPDGNWGDGPRGAGRTREEAFAALTKALDAGNSWSARQALRDLEEAGGELLTGEQLDDLGSRLATADRDLLRDLSHALVVAGGKQGLGLVMGFLEDATQPIERRRQAIDGLHGLPAERAAEAVPALAQFLQSSPPIDLERSAAHAIGQLAGDRGVETLLGLLESHPGIRAEAIFDAVGDVGRPADAKGMLSMLGGDWTPGAKMSLLRATARLATQGGDSSALLGLLREPPAGVSREMVAQALGDASRDLGPGLLADALRETVGDRKAQEALARAMLWSGGKEGLDALLAAAQDPDLHLDARSLARALNDFQGTAAVPLMLELFRTTHDEEVLEPLARGLARNAGKESMESLLGILESGGDAWQRRALARALEDGSAASLSADRILSLLQGEKDQEVATSLARTISRLYPSAIEGRAEELFQGAASPVERIAFAQILEKSGAPGIVEILGAQLRDEADSKAQWEMARILAKIGGDGLAQLADTLHETSDERSKHSLLWGLEASRRPASPDARTLIIDVAGSDPSASIRAQAAEILGRQQDPALVPVLSGLLGSESNREVRERIERAIRELEGRR